VQRTTINLTDEAYEVAQRRIGHKRRGLGNFLSVLVLQDEARRDERILAQRRREQEELPTKQTGQASGVCVD